MVRRYMGRRGRGLWGIVAGAAAAAILIPTAVYAATIEVGVDDNDFIPEVVNPAVGSSVHWSRVAGSDAPHNVAQRNGIFRSGDPTTGAIDLTKTFSAGSFPYLCEVHGDSMAGNVKVKPSTSAGPTGRPFTVTWANSSTNTGNAFDVRYKIGSGGTYRMWKSDTTTFSAVFGKNGAPVTVRAGKAYFFSVRSQTSSANQSDWSPAKSFTP